MRIAPVSSLTALAAALLLAAGSAAPGTVAFAKTPAPAAQASATAPAALQDLVSKVDIPYEKFILPNGLTTIVHTDRKAPIVAVTLYYEVGSKNEPRGRTGFAHLYEHLFFGGSANVPNFDIPLEAAGSTPTNGSTWYDRTNYVETVPTGALDLALFMESDRMGHLLPAVTQDKLDKQRGVVQNEKRQGDNQPYGLYDYFQADGLLPIGHPYRHSTIGSMADLDAATLTDVRTWFTDHYGPNNVVLVLSGDIDAGTARPKVEKWFGGIPRGPAIEPVKAGPVTLPAPVSRDITDQVPVLRLTRNWTAPGLNDPDTPALRIGMHILGGLASSRLDNQLVRGKELAVSVTAYDQVFQQLGFLTMSMDVKPGVARAEAEAAFDKVLADYLREGPTEDEVRRAVTALLSGEIGGLERVGGFSGKGATLAEGQVYSGDPAHYKKDLAAMAALTPASIRAALGKWLSRPVYALNVVPGPRTDSGDALGGWGDEADHPAPPADPHAMAPPLPPAPERTAPPVQPVAALKFPAIEHATLANGIPVTLARRTAVPKLVMAIDFDAGYAADALDTPGTQGLMLAMLEEGTTTRSATQIAEEQERLGANIGTDGSLDTSTVTLSALSDNLAPSLALTADLILHPAFAESDFTRLKAQAQAELAQTLSSPKALAARTLEAEVYGTHPYAQPLDGLGNAQSLAALTPADMRAAHDKWLRPDLARITVVGDVTMEQLKPMLEKAFGQWKAPVSAPPVKPVDAATPAASARIVLIDRPNSPQSVILAGRVLPLTGQTPDEEPLTLANDVIGGDFLSRLNLDIREDKGWSYGVNTSVSQPTGPRLLQVSAPVQADRTGAAIKAIVADMSALPASKPITAEELQRVTEGAIRALPNQFETNASVLYAIRKNDRLGRPENYYEKLAGTYRAIGADRIGEAAREYLQPEGLTFVVVGDRKVVEPQLQDLGLPIEVREAPKGPEEE
ncbi:M16 family metallopeptidase [Novosphingobium mangrovi (ex Huang et al. 2023)]|uniref:Insulinase family protein n=1 Tax=Novosphingobium mangrovi (ex Huang et al. 2023) TaxID=2976432 RepID=A0ABT2I4F6_9SPHN|nr:pitrilysin family protein [Novosphingobium mangrovi (ex Huang et al. 2023)]MCT2399682.1 insulinase family protein [Novosphingobium mangrovi (ex Huang et al. 2023)]